MDTACITYEGVSFEQDLFPRTKEPIWILGKNYSTNKGRDNLTFNPRIRENSYLPQRNSAVKFFICFVFVWASALTPALS